MQAIRRSIARARVRIAVQGWVTAMGWLTLAGLGIAGGMLLTDRLLAVPIPLWSYGVVAGVVILAAAARALLRVPSTDHVAALIDDRLHLKDRLGTALYAESIAADPFAKHVMDDAERTAAATKINRAFPVRPGAVWGWVLPLAAVLAVMAVFVPADLDLLGRDARRQQQRRAQEQAQVARQQIVEAKALIEEAADESDLREADPAEILKELASLTRRDLTNPELRSQAAAELSAVKERLAASRRDKREQFRSLQNQLSRLDAGTPGPADRFADALRRGDFAAAQRELERLAQQIDRGELPQSQQQALRQQLQNMSKQLQQMAQNAAARQQQTQQAINQQLQQAGLSRQQVQQLQQQGYNSQAVQQALQQAYQQQGMPPQQAQRKARQQSQQVRQQQQQAHQQQARSGMHSAMGGALSQMAGSLGRQPGQGRQPGAGAGAGGAGFQQGAWQAQQQLNRMAQMQQQLQRMGMAQSQLQQAMQQMNSPGGAGHKPGPGGGRGGRQAGTAKGGNPLGPGPRQIGPYQTHASGDVHNRQGRVIASWMEPGQSVAGEATVEFDRAVTSARDQAHRAVTEDRVPRRYHEAIKGYFNQLPETAQELRKTAPAAPR